jgi:hypothetical protein
MTLGTAPEERNLRESPLPVFVLTSAFKTNSAIETPYILIIGNFSSFTIAPFAGAVKSTTGLALAVILFCTGLETRVTIMFKQIEEGM